MSELTLQAEARDLTGRKVRQLRRQGLVPAIIYGNDLTPESLQINARSLDYALHHGAGSQLVTLEVAGGPTHNVLVREVQRDPVSHHLLHADFYAVNMSEKQVVTVPLQAIGTPEALGSDVTMLQALDQVEIEALPASIPAVIEVDVSALSLENTITVADLPAVEGVTYLSAEDEPVFTMVTVRVAEEEEEEELLEGEMVEPEVVGAEREEEEEEE